MSATPSSTPALHPIRLLGFADLQRHIASGEVSSVEATRVLLDAIDAVQPTLAAYTHVYHRRAMEQARAADARRAAGQPRSPWDGVPISLKESIATEGDEMTLGLPSKKGQLATTDAVLASIVKDAGCVILGKTNLSQAMLFHESRNPLFGQAANPWDLDRTPGGSSGGEAAAIAAYASPGGFGTDIGGSIRVPSHFCGTVGLKPTVDRISNLGLGSGIPGQEVIRGQIGPMARSVDDLIALLELVSPEKCAERDPRVPGLPIGDPRALLPEKLRIGWFVTDHVVEPSAACQRAVHEAKEALEGAGCELVAIEPAITEELVFTYMSALSADGGKTLTAALAGGEIDSSLTLLLKMVSLPKPARKAAALALGVAGERIAGRTVEAVGEKTVRELWKITKRCREIQAEVFAHWQHRELDAVICPPFATPALTHRASKDFSIAGALAFRYNLLDFPAGSVPVTRVHADEVERSRQRERHERRASSIDRDSVGLPVGVQVAALPRREDKVLRVMGLIEAALADREELRELPPLD
jgi:fatty acid amide hydrolase